MTRSIVAVRRAAALAGAVLITVAAGACGATAAPSSPPHPSSTPSSAAIGTALASPQAFLASPQPAALGASGDFWGSAALSQPAGRAAVAYLEARAVAAVVPAALAALPAFFVPRSPDIARESYLARGKHAQWMEQGSPPARTVDSVEPSSVSLTVQNRDASFAGYATDMTSFASGRSDQEGEGLDHTIALKWVGGRWLVQEDAYVSDGEPGQLAKGGAPQQMVAAAAEVASTLGQAGPAEIAAATGVVRTFVRLVDQGRYLAAQRLVRRGSHVSAPELGREVAHLKVLRAQFTDVPGQTAIEFETTLRVEPRAGSDWAPGSQRVYFTVTRESIRQAWLIDEYSFRALKGPRASTAGLPGRGSDGGSEKREEKCPRRSSRPPHPPLSELRILFASHVQSLTRHPGSRGSPLMTNPFRNSGKVSQLTVVREGLFMTGGRSVGFVSSVASVARCRPAGESRHSA